jgi:transcriptional antiterminator NusG
MKKWYIIQTYAGSELKVKEQLEKRVREWKLEGKLEAFNINGEKIYFLAPVEEVITSKSRRGRAGEHRVPYEYELVIESNKRIKHGDLIARKPPRYIAFDATVKKIEPFQRVIIEMTNRNEEVYLIPATSKIRRDIRTGEKIRSGVPLTQDGKYIAGAKGKIVMRDKVKKITFEKEDGSTVSEVIPERYLVKLREGMKLRQGDMIEKEDKIHSNSSGMVRIREYKDKRVVAVQRIDKRRLFPGYIFAKMEMDEEIMQLTKGIKCRFVGSPPLPLSEEEMKVVKRRAGLEEVPKHERPKIEIDFEVGEVVEIVEGPFADFTGEIAEIDKENEEITVMVRIFGRETPVKLGFEGIEKL